MKFLFTCLPGFGHLHPMLPLAKELAGRGHEILFASSPSFVPVITKTGFRAVSAGIPWDESRLEDTVPEIRGVPLADRMFWLSKVVFLDRSPKSMVPDLLKIVSKWPPDAIVSNRFEIAGSIVSEITGIPLAGVNISLRCPKTVDLEFYGQEISTLWAHFGLPQDPELSWLGKWLEISLMPATWTLADFAKGPTEFFIRPQYFDQTGDEQLPTWISDLPQQPTIHATLGTVFNQQPLLFDCILEALREAGVNLIMTIGRNQDPARFGKVPAHVKIERYIPTSTLLPYINLSINHGGYGSVMSPLTHGIPMVILPLSADQPFIASLANKHGVAVPLPTNFLSPSDGKLPPLVNPTLVSPEGLRSLIKCGLEDTQYRRAAASLASTMASMPDVGFAADLVEKLANERMPIINDNVMCARK